MSAIKSESNKNARSVLNTTIEKVVLDDFKARCKGTGLPMNMVIETFMQQFSSGEFILKVGKSSRLDIEE